MTKLLLVATTICFLCTACTKNENATKAPQNTPNPLTLFTVSIVERNSNTAIIDWTKSINITNNDTIKYKVILNNRVLDTSLVRTLDTIYRISPDTIYNGKVIAFTKSGDTISASFILDIARAYAFYRNSCGAYLCYEIYSGKNVWSTTCENSTIGFSPPTISNDTVFFTSSKNGVKALNIRNGQLLWSAPASSGSIWSEFAGNPTYYEGALYMVNAAGVVAIDSKNGNTLKTYLPRIANFYSTPVISNNRIFFGTQNSYGTFYSYDINGTFLWKVEGLRFMCQRPVFFKDMVIISASGSIFAFSQLNGSVVWQASIGSNSISPIVYKGKIYGVGTKGIFAIDANTGTMVWNYYVYPQESFDQPIIGDDQIYFSHNNNDSARIFALNAASGEVIWRNATKSFAAINLLYFNRRLIYLQNGYIKTINAVNGKITYYTDLIDTWSMYPHGITVLYKGIPFYPPTSSMYNPQ